MALSDILQKIRADYAERAQKIVESAMTEAENFIRNTEKDERQKNEERWNQVVKHKKDAIKKAQTKADLASKQRILAQKRELITEVLSSARKQMVKMQDIDYIKFLIPIISDIDSKEGKIISAKNRVNDTKKAVSQSHKPFSVSEGSFDGGIIFKSEDVEINATFDRLFEDFQKKNESEIAKILFQ